MLKQVFLFVSGLSAEVVGHLTPIGAARACCENMKKMGGENCDGDNLCEFAPLSLNKPIPLEAAISQSVSQSVSQHSQSVRQTD